MQEDLMHEWLAPELHVGMFWVQVLAGRLVNLIFFFFNLVLSVIARMSSNSPQLVSRPIHLIHHLTQHTLSF